ncbi:uncharacterized protein IL334_000755 [Kwoniella shivajii]|uniref:HORMA domain-containing protein n=1 Tax=Kwoniella shivajii TaxID=564305 RepID=A0ABZ1CRJ9_9TREE|nr:hypothetical protein IL334_000755 [Kwoniella shivajii]
MTRGPAKQAFRPPAPVQKSNTTQSSQQSGSQRGTRTNQDLAIVSKQDSFEILRVVLEANIGIICYLRNLLSNDDFDLKYIAGSSPPAGQSPSDLYRLTKAEALAADNGQASQLGTLTAPKLFNWFSVKPDETTQGRWLRDRIQVGAMDALQKGYLQSLMLVIFLDDKDPTNVIETYSFNFFYHEHTGIPSMQMEHTVRGSQQSQAGREEKQKILGTPMTYLDVRREVKQSATLLIKICTALEDLPKKRFMDLKLFYNNKAPEDYVAPGFRDSSSEKMILGTHHVDNPPLKLSTRDLQTGHHGVALTALNVVHYLPKESEEDDEAPRNDPEFYAHRFQEVDDQVQDAKQRIVIWDADMPAHDRSAYDSSAPDVYTASVDPKLATASNIDGALIQPIGKLTEDGDIAVIRPSQKGKDQERATRDKNNKNKKGRTIAEDTLQMSQTLADPFRRKVAQSLSRSASGLFDNEETLFDPRSQASFIGNSSQSYLARIDEVDVSEDAGGDVEARSSASRAKGTGSQDRGTHLPSQPKKDRLDPISPNDPDSSDDRDISQPHRKARKIDAVIAKVEGIKAKAVRTPKAKSDPKSKSRSDPRPKPRSRAKPRKAVPKKPRKKTARNSTPLQEQMECFCGSRDELDPMVQCDGCHKWLHSPCMGFMVHQSASQIKLFCIVCEMQKDETHHWTKKETDAAAREMAVLSLTRRTMEGLRKRGAIASNELPALQYAFGCSVRDIHEVLKTLEDEGIAERIAETRSAPWKWAKHDSALTRYAAYFKYGGGVENERFAYRKFHMSSQSNTSAILQLNNAPEPFQLPPIRTSRSNKPIECTETWVVTDNDA